LKERLDELTYLKPLWIPTKTIENLPNTRAELESLVQEIHPEHINFSYPCPTCRSLNASPPIKIFNMSDLITIIKEALIGDNFKPMFTVQSEILDSLAPERVADGLRLFDGLFLT
jgi:hypothetical protein